MMIRSTHQADLPSILTVYNEVIVASTAKYFDEPGDRSQIRPLARSGFCAANGGWNLSAGAIAIGPHQCAADDQRRSVAPPGRVRRG
jgi:hypothetical protein